MLKELFAGDARLADYSEANLAPRNTTPRKVPTALIVAKMPSIGRFHPHAALRAEIRVAMAGSTIDTTQRSNSYNQVGRNFFVSMIRPFLDSLH